MARRNGEEEGKKRKRLPSFSGGFLNASETMVICSLLMGHKKTNDNLTGLAFVQKEERTSTMLPGRKKLLHKLLQNETVIWAL